MCTFTYKFPTHLKIYENNDRNRLQLQVVPGRVSNIFHLGFLVTRYKKLHLTLPAAWIWIAQATLCIPASFASAPKYKHFYMKLDCRRMSSVQRNWMEKMSLEKNGIDWNADCLNKD